MQLLDVRALFAATPTAPIEIGFGNGDKPAGARGAHPARTFWASEVIVRASAGCCSARGAAARERARHLSRRGRVFERQIARSP